MATQVSVEVQGVSAKGRLQWPVPMTAVFLDWPSGRAASLGSGGFPLGWQCLRSPAWMLALGLWELVCSPAAAGRPPAPLPRASEVSTGAQWAWEWAWNPL